MIPLSEPVLRSRVLLLISLVALCCRFPLHAQDGFPECSLSKTNRSCQLVIDRSNPVAPSTVQMYSDQELRVVIENPLPFERYFLDLTSGQATVNPDVASAITGSVATSSILGKLTNLITSDAESENPNLLAKELHAAPQPPSCDKLNLDNATLPAPTTVQNLMPNFRSCFIELADKALKAYQELEPLVGPDALTSHTLDPTTYYFQNTLHDDIHEYTTLEIALSKKVTLMAAAPATTDKPTSPPTPPTSQYTVEDEAAISKLGVYQKLIDAVTADLAGYQQRLSDLGPCGYVRDANKTTAETDWDNKDTYSLGDRAAYSGHCYTSAINNNTGNQPDGGKYWTEWTFTKNSPVPSITITSRADDESIYQNMVTRTITYSLDTLNLVSNSQQAAPTAANKKALATIAINFADEPNNKFLGNPYTALRWEASAGVFFSWLPSRTFTLTPPSNGCGASTGNGTSTGTGASTTKVYDCTTRPTPVPFAAANYRLTGDLGGRWKQNVYMTGAIGVNPINTTAEFGVGPSYAWRGFTVSALCHIGHDTKWLNMTPGSNGELPTYTHWTVKAAVGISVRVPSLTGR